MAVRPIFRRALQLSALLILLQTTGCSELEQYQKQRDITAYVVEGDRQMTLGNLAKARDFFDRAIALDPHSSAAYLGGGDSGGYPTLVSSLTDHGDFPDLANYLTKAVADPKLGGDWQLYAALADAQDRLGQKAASQASYAKELALITSPAKGSPGTGMDPVAFQVNKASAEWGSGNHALGRADFKRAIETYPDQADGPENDLAYSEAVAGENLQEALAYATSAVKIARDAGADDEQIGEYLDTLGWVQYQLGQYGNAQGSLEEAIGDIPRESVSHYHLAKIYHALGRNDDALIEVNRSMILDPSSPDTQTLLAQLQPAPSTKKPTLAGNVSPTTPPAPVGATSHA